MSANSRQSLRFYLSKGLWAAVAMAVLGCGYRALYGLADRSKVSVNVGQILVPETGAAQAALSGARSELAGAGRLSNAPEFPRLTLDVLRVDEVSRGIYVRSGQPIAAGMSVAVVVRARLLVGPESEPALDTGDVRRATQVSGDADPRTDSAAYEQAVRAAAERAGRAAARIALGIPEPNDEAP